MELERGGFADYPDTRRVALGVAFNGDEADISAWVERNLVISGWFQAIIPLMHERQPEGWNAYVIGLLNIDNASRDTIDLLVERMQIESKIVWVDYLEQQINLDMFYPLEGGAQSEQALSQSIEYVQTNPDARVEYNQTQSAFTGPAMRRLHQRHRAGRFIGFECLFRLSGPDDPYFDVIHLSGFLPGQKDGGEQDFWHAFDAAAQSIGRVSGRSVMQSWDKQRTRRFLLVNQINEASLTASELES